jgi:hypothetical protein
VREFDAAFVARTCDFDRHRQPLSTDERSRRRRAWREVRDWLVAHGDEYPSAGAACEPCRSAVLAALGLVLVEAVLSELVKIWIDHWFGVTAPSAWES